MSNVKEKVKEINREINKRKVKIVLEEIANECSLHSDCGDQEDPCPYFNGSCLLKDITDTNPWEWNI